MNIPFALCNTASQSPTPLKIQGKEVASSGELRTFQSTHIQSPPLQITRPDRSWIPLPRPQSNR